MKHIHRIMALIRFFEHGIFITLIFELSPNDNNGNDTIHLFSVYFLCAFTGVFVFYLYFMCVRATINTAASTNRTLSHMVEFEMWQDIRQMLTFG